LDHLLSEEEKAIPLRMPSPEEYCFAVEDAEDNIVFEEGQGVKKYKAYDFFFKAIKYRNKNKPKK